MFPVLFLLLSAVAPRITHAQVAQTAAICSPEFAWTGNSQGASPCLIAARLDALCNNGNWDIIALNASIHYNNPSTADGTASLCTCSWASYNLLSACTVCQGFPQAIPIWGAYSSQCGNGLLSQSYWPPSIALPAGLTIPFWASTNPSQWTNQQFSQAQAKKIQEKGQPDLGAAPPPKKKSKPVGAIVGGVIGGLAVIAGFAVIALFMIRRQKKQIRAEDSSSVPMNRPPHERKISETTADSHMKSVAGWTTLTSSTPITTNPPYSPTIHTHTPSVSSLPFFSSVIGSTTHESPSPPPPRNMTSTPRRQEDIITPFTLPPTNDNVDRKQSNGEWPVYDAPNAPPSNALRMEITPALTPSRPARYNPPAYTESSPGGSSKGTPQRHRAQESSDSNHSNPSNSNSAGRATHTPANSGSSTGHMGISSPLSTSASELLASPQSQGRSLAGPSTDAKRHPRQDSIDIA